MHHTTDMIAHTTAFATPFNYSTKTILSIMISYFRTFDLSCSILEKDNFIENVYIVLSCLIK